MKKTLSNFNIRIEEDIKKRFIKVAQQNEEVASKLMRRWIKKYLADNAQGKLI